jgi:hypothetical protein
LVPSDAFSCCLGLFRNPLVEAAACSREKLVGADGDISKFRGWRPLLVAQRNW